MEKLLSQFESINLSEMDSVKLMNRVDEKYIIPFNLIDKILSDAAPFYRILDINNLRLSTYKSLYYDTPRFDLYHSHQRGKSNRYKIRSRNYVDSDASFFEIKHKNQKGRTIKTRIEQNFESYKTLNDIQIEFLRTHPSLNHNLFAASLCVNYKRITLVNKNLNERVTLDLELSFESEKKFKGFSDIVIAEIKQDKFKNSEFIQILKKYQLRSGSVSKYCLGMLSLNADLKHNRFKEKLIHLHKIQNQNHGIKPNLITN